jgi:hypothetical protein
MPEDVAADFNEAREVLGASPRSSAALLRLAIQKLCAHLGGEGKSINDYIADFVEKGLSVEVQQALDIVRVVGNNAVHPGEIDIRDDPQTAMSLFDIINFVVERMISQPKAIAKMFGGLPIGAREAIRKRDGMP